MSYKRFLEGCSSPFMRLAKTPHGASRLAQAMPAWLAKTRRAPSRHSRGASVYGHTTTAMRKLSATPPPMEKCGRLESSEKTIAILADRWWPQTAKQDGDRISKHFICSIWKKRNERPNVGGASIRSRNGAPSRKRCVANGQMTKDSNK